MANSYLTFSEVIARLDAHERKWVRRVLGCDRNVRRTLSGAGLRVSAVDLEDWPGFQWQFNDADSELWLHADESGNVDHVGEFVRAFLARFRPNECWTLTWAETCSKPRVGEFGGGALFITAKALKTFRAAKVIHRLQIRFEKNRPIQPTAL